MEVVILIAKCNDCGKLYGIRVEKMNNGGWQNTWAFPLSDKNAKTEKYDSFIEGKISLNPNYPGCPYCKSEAFFKCSCGKLSCWDGYSSEAKCSWCGKKSNIGGSIKELEGGKF